MKRLGAGAVAALLMLGAGVSAQARPLRVMALDQCADQYVLALAPDAELALSPRADDPDSHMRAAARGHRRLRPTLEAAVAFRPEVVVRYWGGEPRLLARLEQGGARVVSIQDATDFDGVRAQVEAVAAGLGRPDRGADLIARMDADLARAAAAGARRGPRTALYLTAGGFTAGPGTLMDAILRAAGLINLTTAPGFGPVSVERLALAPPAQLVLGFFDQARADWRGPGRHPVVRKAARGRVAASLPAATLTCPAWFAAEAAMMAAGGR